MKKDIIVGWVVTLIVAFLFFALLIYGAFAFGVDLGMALYIFVYGPIALGAIILTWIIIGLSRFVRK